jgi:hypothetical protein
MPKAKQPPQAEKIIEFAKRLSNSQQHKDHYVSTSAGPMLGRRVYCVEWGYDEDEAPEYWCYVTARTHDPSQLEYFDDETALFSALSTVSSEMDNDYRMETLRQRAELAFDVFAGLIALAITITIIATVFIETKSGKDISQLWNIFAVIIGYYFGKTAMRKSEVKAGTK